MSCQCLQRLECCKIPYRRKAGSSTLTLMKPPSGFARRNAGCGFILGSKSCTFSNFLNRGTGPRGMSKVLADLGGRKCRGDLASRPNTALSCAVAELG